jgi:3-hydroxymyristoyl/3-hydroxydecanoyl-(acyl carrier protein) dehydratase
VDALMYADGKAIVKITDMSLRMTGLDQKVLESLWSGGQAENESVGIGPVPLPPLYGRERILEYCEGRPSKAFGPAYRIFDDERRLARLPRPPYLFLDRIVAVEGKPFEMVAGAACQAQVSVAADSWYFGSNRQAEMPTAILLEIALQPCGWLAAYVGSALEAPGDVRFRNLGGSATLHHPICAGPDLLTTSVKMTKVSNSGGVIIQNFEMEVASQQHGLVYSGDTYFGFFSADALADQVGLRNAKPYLPAAIPESPVEEMSNEAPFADSTLSMLDEVDVFEPEGGRLGLGFVRGVKNIRSDEWFFRAHFYQDPVWPGSLGIEAFVQLMKWMAAKRWGARPTTRFCTTAAGVTHRWVYRGQVVPNCSRVEVQASVTAVDDTQHRLRADGYLSVDGRMIYEMADFELEMVP